MSFFSRSKSTTKAQTVSSATAARTSNIFTVPSDESSVKKKWNYDAAQLGMIEELKKYSKSITLPETDPYYPWELRFLSDPGTHARYMRAAKWKMHDAQLRIKGTMEWRREFKPELIQPGDVGIEAETGKIIISGFDNDCRPIIYMRPGRENTETSPRQIRHLIFHLERAIDLMPPGQEQVAIIVDYKSATSQSNPSISTARKVLHILQNHYVERLGRGLVVNMSWWINAFFSGISPFLDPITRDKIRFNPKLTELVPAAQLDAEFGGDYPFDYDYNVYWKTLTEFCHIAEDGTRIGHDGKPGWIPSAGNGIKSAWDGFGPRPDAVVSGDIVKIDSDSEAKDSAAGKHAEAVVSGAAPSAANGSPTDGDQTEVQKLAVATNSETVEGTGTTIEDDMKKLAVSTAPGEPGQLTFDHPPSENEIAEARKSLEVKA